MDSSSGVGSGNGGGYVEDVLKRLGNLETHVSDLRSQVSAVSAIIPHLATKADVVDVRTSVAELKADLSSEIGAVKANLSAEIGAVKADLASTETVIIKWVVVTGLALGALAFTIAKFVH
jgi:hypothetical protein